MAILRETLFCPVCNEKLGQRFKYEVYIAHCSICETKFIWKPGNSKPDALLDKDNKVPKACNCGRCGR